MTPQQVIEEYTKCYLDMPYYGSKYCNVFDLTRGGTFPLKVFPKQKQLLEHYRKNRFSLVLKPRQAGVSTVTAFHCAHLIMFAPKAKKQLILIIANMQETAFEFLAKIKSFVDTAPSWLLEHNKDGNVIYTKNNSGYIELPNGSGAKAKATSKDALRGYAPTLLVLDEAAFIEHSEDLWMAALPVLSTGGGAILLSTPNGFDPLYHALYNAAIKGENDFKIFEMNWYQDPRFNKDLRWVKKITVGEEEVEEVHICKRNEDDTNWDFAEFPDLVKNGYKPTSSWFEEMCRQYNNDKRKIAQELECNFLGSGDNVFDEETIAQQEIGVINEEEVHKEHVDRKFWIFEKPKPNTNYMMGIDVSSGESADYSTISIWDMDNFTQVAEYQGKIRPDLLGILADRYGRKYGDALAIVDITGGIGQTTIIKMLDLSYPNIHYSLGAGSAVVKQQLKRYKQKDDKIPGFTIGINRSTIIETFEIALRGGAKSKSKRLIEEMRTFIYKNGRPDHQNGCHDDLIFAAAMVHFVFQYDFKNMKRYKAQTLAMLNAWGTELTTRPSLHNSPVDPLYNNDHSWVLGG